MKSSSLSFHAKAPEGKYPYLFSSGKAEEPSALIVAVNKYLCCY